MADDGKNKLQQAHNLGLIRPKRVEIATSKANNEPLLSLTFIEQFLESIKQSIDSSSDDVSNPAPDVIRIIASRNLTQDKYKFFTSGIKQEDAENITTNPLAYLENNFYPEDIINFVAYFRAWIINKFKDTLEISWDVSEQSLNGEWRSALESESKEKIAAFSKSDLKEALEELIKIAQSIIEKESLSDEDLDEVEDVIGQITDGIGSHEIQRIVGVWEDLTKEIIKILSNAQLEATSLIIPDKTISIHSGRKVLNKLYGEINLYINKDRVPWKNLIDKDGTNQEIKQRFLREETLLTSSKIEIPENDAVDNSDKNIASHALEFYNKFFKALAQKPKEEEEETSPDEDKTEDGGGEVADEPQLPDSLTEEELLEKIIQDLPTASWQPITMLFSEEHDLTQLSPEQLKLLQSKTANFIANNIDVEQIDIQLNYLIAPDLDQETKRYLITANRQQELLTKLASSLVSLFETALYQIYENVISERVEEAPLDDKPSKPTSTAVVPPGLQPVEAPAQTQFSKDLAVERQKLIEAATIALIGMDFEGYSLEEFPTELRAVIRKALEESLDHRGSLTLDDLRVSRGTIIARIISQARLNKDFYTAAESFFESQLLSLGIDNIVDKTHIDRAIDTLLSLSSDPQQLIKNLSDEQIKIFFNIKDNRVDINKLRLILLGLSKIRKTRISKLGFEITPIFKEEKAQKHLQKNINSYFVDHYKFLEKTGDNGLALTHANSEQLELYARNRNEDDSIFQKELEALKIIHQQRWNDLISGLDEGELIEVYQFYEIDFIEFRQQNPTKLPVPESFIFSKLAQQAHSAGSDPRFSALAGEGGLNLKKKLTDKADQLIGKIALDVITSGAAEPFTKALKALGIDVEKEVGEKIRKALEIVGVVSAGLMAGIIALLRTLGMTALLTAIGAGIGTIIMPGLGTIIGSITGGISGNILSHGTAGVKSAASKLGITSAGKAASTPGVITGTGAAKLFKLGAASTAVGTALVIPTVTNNINLKSMINSQIRPIYNTSADTIDSAGEYSKYVTLEKTSPVGKEVDNPPGDTLYQVTISADKGYNITITSATDTNNISFKDEGKGPESNTIGLSELVGATILAGESFPINYSQIFGGEYMDSRITNSFSIDFDYQKGEEVGVDTATTIYSIGIGDYPVGEGCWPTTGEFTQGPLSSPNKFGASHDRIQAIDIHSSRGTAIISPFSGEACSYPKGSGWVCASSYDGTPYCYGNHVVLNTGTAILGFAHLQEFSSNIKVGGCTTISAGEPIGLMGNSGLGYSIDRGVHLHYELRPKSLRIEDLVPGPMIIHQIKNLCLGK